MKVDFVSKTTGIGKYKDLSSEEIIAAIARHGVIKSDNGRLVRYLMDNKHWSPLDMVNFVFEIETSRSIGRQILRHWSMKFQEHSQRYSSSVAFEKISIRKEHPTNRQSSTDEFNPLLFNRSVTASSAIKKHLVAVNDLYFELINNGVAKECARELLPGCTTTVITVNGTLRSWLSFLNVRSDHHAQKEIQELANLIGTHLEKEMPDVFGEIDWKKGMFM